MGTFEETAEMMVTGPGVRLVTQLLTLATQVTSCSAAGLIVRRESSYQILQAVGYFGSKHGDALAIPGKTKYFPHDYLEIVDEKSLSDISNLTGFGPWKWAAISQILLPDLPYQVGIICVDKRNSNRRGDFVSSLRIISSIFGEQWRLMQYIIEKDNFSKQSNRYQTNSEFYEFDDRQPNSNQKVHDVRQMAFDIGPSGDNDLQEKSNKADGNNIVADFLLRTLMSRKKMLSRDGVSYHTVRCWRSAIKDSQISALRSLKSDPPAGFVEQIAAEIEAAAKSLYGQSAFKAVVPVPCGNSGPACLTERVAHAVARRMGIDAVEAFEPLVVRGSSHPKRNIRRPAMKLRVAPDVPVLLIDDVATSGAHIAEAATKLREKAPAVFPIAWIAGG